MKNCLDTGTIQAFLDGELAPAEAASVSAHIAQCDACAAQLATAEEESVFVFSVLGREMDTLVPTQRLWTKINDSIVVEKQSAPFWKKAWAYIIVSLANPSIAVAAGVVIVLGVSAVMWIESGKISNQDDLGNPPRTTIAKGDAPPPIVINGSDTGNGEKTAGKAEGNDPARVVNASFHRENRSEIVTPKARKALNVVPAAYIPGEESYVKTIASLSQTVDNQKDTAMHPSERVAYERDMAVVNDAIKKMKDEVRRNPKNESAKQVLYTSYQNKIDLLNSVSQREELVASLK
jgi:hypothetical protein